VSVVAPVLVHITACETSYTPLTYMTLNEIVTATNVIQLV